jgi:hypothetical protein
MENNPIQCLLSPRCGAKTRKQTPCLAPAVRGNKRCRMHGGKGSGAPTGSQNALKHGHYTHEARAERREVRGIIKKWREFKGEL